MQQSRPASLSRFRGRAVTVAGAVIALTAAPHTTAVAHADPEPSTKELRSQALKLADQLEQVTEQYNGLKVKLSQSKRAAKVATENAERQEKALQAIRQKVGTLAATSYMQGGSDPTVSFVASQDPQAVLDQAATLHYFAKQDSTKVLGLMQAMQAAQRARKSAEERAKQVKDLRTQLESQRKKVTDAYEKVRGKIVKRDPTQLAKPRHRHRQGRAGAAVRHGQDRTPVRVGRRYRAPSTAPA